MKTFWLIQAFDAQICVHFIPDPALFETEEEAKEFCKTMKTDTIALGYRPLRLDHLDGDKGAN